MEPKKCFKIIFLFSFFLFAILNLISFRIIYAQDTRLEAHFPENAQGFNYLDDTFLNTDRPPDADGVYTATEGYSNGGLKVQLGPVAVDSVKVSGGWRRLFNLPEQTRIQLSFRYNLSQLANFQQGEYSQVLVSVDGELYGFKFDAVDGHKYIDQITDQGPTSTEWQEFEVEFGPLASGEHTLIIGGYGNYISTQNSGSSALIVDDVLVEQSTEEGVLASLSVGMPSPTAASLGKFGDIPVSFYTGTPNIGIPLYELKSRDLTLPISLNYHASGIKVEAIAGWVGLGWALNAGGVITRTVRGLPDDYVSGYYSTGDSLYSPNNWNNPTNQYLDDVSGGIKDSEPDLFFFNFAGIAGQFNIGLKNNTVYGIRTIPYQKIRIEPIFSGTLLEEWSITTEDGTAYTFSQEESTTNFPTTGGTVPVGPFTYISSWHLKQVKSPHGPTVINFEYSAPVTITHELRTYEEELSFSYGTGCSFSNVNVQDDYSIETIRLTKITTDTETLDFFSSNRQEDITDEYQLDSLRITKNSFIQKTIIFQYDYFNQGSANARLRLDAVQEKGSDGMLLPSHKFEYFSSVNLPSRLDNGIDHWGYYNGVSNLKLLPGLVVNTISTPVFLQGADREPNPSKMKAGILTKIIYPTGGHTEFEFEAHDYGYIESSKVTEDLGPIKNASVKSNIQATFKDTTIVIGGIDDVVLKIDVTMSNPCPEPLAGCPFAEIRDSTNQGAIWHTDDPVTDYQVLSPDTYILRVFPDNNSNVQMDVSWREVIPANVKTAGGLRIKEIRTFDAISTDTLISQYEYKTASDPSDPDRSSGVIVAEPRYHYWSPSNCNYLSRSSLSRMPLGLTQGSHIGYSEVTVFHGANGVNGTTRHRFTSARDYLNAILDPIENIWPFGSKTSYDWKRGKLKDISVFDSAGVLQQQTKSTHKFRDEDSEPETTTKYRGLSLVSLQGGSGARVYSRFEIISAWAYQDSQNVTVYDQNGQNPFTTTREFVYDNPSHIQLTKSIEINNDGTKRITRTTYPEDYSNTSGSSDPVVQAVDSMKTSKHMHNTVIEQWLSEQKVGQSEQVVSAQLVLPKEFATGQILRHQGLQFSNPTPVTNFSPSRVTSGNFNYDSRYLLQQSIQSYDSYGNPLQVLDAEGVETTYSWEESSTLLDKITRRPDPGTDLTIDYNYNNNLLLSEIIDPDGQKTTFEYDTLQRLIKTKNHDAQEVSMLEYFYSRTGSGNDTFDPADPNYVRQTLKRSGTEQTVSTSYLDGLGRQISSQVRDGNDDIVQYNTHDALGRPDSSFKALQLTNSNHHFVQRSEFPGGALYQLTEYEANPLNRVNKIINFDGTEINLAYKIESLSGDDYRFVERTDEVSDVTKEYADEFGRKVAGINGEGGKTELIYDILDNLTTSRPPNYFNPPTGSVASDWQITYNYNTLSQLTLKHSPDADTVQSKYDKNGNPRFFQDANQQATGEITFVTNDGINRPLITGEAEADFSTLDGQATYSFESDSSNWIQVSFYDTATIPSSDFPWNLFDYTNVGVLANTVGRLTGSAFHTIGGDKEERVSGQTYSPGSVETVRSLGSITADSSTVESGADVTLKAGASITLGDGFHIKAGAIFSATLDPDYEGLSESWQVTLFSYDNNGRVATKYVLTREKGSQLETRFDYQHDRQGNVKQVDVQHDGNVYHYWYIYNERGLLERVKSASGAEPALADFEFDYTPTALVDIYKINETSSNNFQTTVDYTYHDRDWLTDINDVDASIKPFSARYAYYDDGNIQTATFYNDKNGMANEAVYSFGFTYDSRKQLTAADYSESGASSEYDVDSLQYDPNGNITNLIRNDETGNPIDNLDYQYGSNNQLQTLVENGPVTTVDWDAENATFDYDANGNVIQVTENGANKISEMLYDTRNLPIFLLKEDSTEIIYQYNADGQRIYKKVDNQGPEFYIMDGSLNIGVVTGGFLAHWNIVANGVAGRVEGSNKLYYVKDHLGSTRSAINASGLPQESYDYYPFGLHMPGRTLNAGTKELFTGKERDTETGWDYFGARYYDPSIGRWVVVDPRAGNYPSLSPYVYVANNPLGATDPDGEWINFLVGGLIGGAVDFGLQVAGNVGSGQSFSEAVGDVNFTQVGISALAGAASSGISSLAKVGTIGKLLTNASVNTTAGAAKNVVSGEQVTPGSIALDFGIGLGSGVAGSLGQATAQSTNTGNALAKNAKRLTNIASTGRPRAAQTIRATTAQAKAQNFGAGKISTSANATASGVVGNVLNSAQPIQLNVPTNPTTVQLGVANSDNTRTVVKIEEEKK